jgi:enamine deaminase RidA (YjgF/YER057c/UK114 family)
MEMQPVNPWKWQDQFGFVQANEVTGANRMLICAGQTAMDENGVPQHAGDITAQANLALDNLETVLKQAGMTLANVARINIYTTDMDAFFAANPQLIARLQQAGCKPASTLLGVSRLALPGLMIELEATAVA